MRLVDKPRDYETEAQQAAEAHLEACWAWLDYEEYEGDKPEGMDDSPAWAPFDGCMTCEVRETLHAVWSIVTESANAR